MKLFSTPLPFTVIGEVADAKVPSGSMYKMKLGNFHLYLRLLGDLRLNSGAEYKTYCVPYGQHEQIVGGIIERFQIFAEIKQENVNDDDWRKSFEVSEIYFLNRLKQGEVVEWVELEQRDESHACSNCARDPFKNGRCPQCKGLGSVGVNLNNSRRVCGACGGLRKCYKCKGTRVIEKIYTDRNTITVKW
ncbi:MAG: hypothetical protein HOD72_01860 [Opitutae bacterium]|nr:hypothetical protein [Opitutae bacterium]